MSVVRVALEASGTVVQGWGAISCAWGVLPETVHQLPKLVVIGQRDRDEVRVLGSCVLLF